MRGPAEPHRHRPPRPAWRMWIGAGLLAGLPAGCGYSNDSLHRPTIRTVYVDVPQSKEFRRGIEFELAEALRKEIDRSTPYKNAPREQADSILTAEVLEWREATLGNDPITALPRETAATPSVRFRWQDVRTGKLLVDQPRFVTTVDYVRPTGESEFHARRDAVNKLAHRMVEAMATPW